jgi:hypothetical protein
MAAAGLVVWLVAQGGRAEEPSSPPEAAVVTIPSPLHLDDAVSIFRARGFDLLLAEAATESARGDLRSARAFPNPVVTASGGRSFTYDPDRCDQPGCSATAVSAGLSDQGLLADLLIGTGGSRSTWPSRRSPPPNAPATMPSACSSRP